MSDPKSFEPAPSGDPTRRGAISAIGLAMAAAGWPSLAATRPAVRTVAFDAFVLFDPAPLRLACGTIFGERGDAVAQLWSTKLFGYTWLLNSLGRYEPFSDVAAKALLVASASAGNPATPKQAAELAEMYGELKPWPDVAHGLAELASAGVRATLLSNLGERHLHANLTRAGLTDAVRPVLSTDRVRRFKPAPTAYAMATRALGLHRGEIAFAAFAGWDAVGAKSFGYRTAWVNRSGGATETLGPVPDLVGADIRSVLTIAGAEGG